MKDPIVAFPTDQSMRSPGLSASICPKVRSLKEIHDKEIADVALTYH